VARWDDPYRIGAGQTKSYDRNTIGGLAIRAQQGDRAAKHALAQVGFTDQYGNYTYGNPNDIQGAINAWATTNSLQAYKGQAAPDPWTDANKNAWADFFREQTGYAPTTDPNALGGGPPPVTTSGQPQARVTNETGQETLPGGGVTGQPLVFLNDWAYGGDQLGGGQYVNGRWVHGAPVAAGTDLGTLGVAKTTGFVLPVGYDSRADTGRYELNGQVGETGWSRVLRKAQEFMQGGKTAFKDAFNRALAIVNQEAAAQGKSSGFGAATAPGTVPPAGTQPPAATDPAQAAPPAANAETGGYPPGSPEAAQFLRDQALGGTSAQSKMARQRYMMQSLGLDPDKGGIFGQSILNNIKDPLERFLQLQGISDPNSGGRLQNAQGTLNNLTQMLSTGGLRSVGRWAQEQKQRALAPGSPLLNGSPELQSAALYDLMALGTTGMNDYVAQSYADYFGNAMGGYSDYNLGALGSGAIQDPIEWLRQSRWADLLG
jgi:hypothetical protein